MIRRLVPVPTRAYKCPYCSQMYQRLSLRLDPHPEADKLPCFDCAKKGAHHKGESRVGARIRD